MSWQKLPQFQSGCESWAFVLSVCIKWWSAWSDENVRLGRKLLPLSCRVYLFLHLNLFLQPLFAKDCTITLQFLLSWQGFFSFPYLCVCVLVLNPSVRVLLKLNVFTIYTLMWFMIYSLMWFMIYSFTWFMLYSLTCLFWKHFIGLPVPFLIWLLNYSYKKMRGFESLQVTIFSWGHLSKGLSIAHVRCLGIESVLTMQWCIYMRS